MVHSLPHIIRFFAYSFGFTWSIGSFSPNHPHPQSDSSKFPPEPPRVLTPSVTPRYDPAPVEPMDHHHSLSTGSPLTLGSDSAKRKRSDGSRLALVEMHDQASSYMSPQSVRAPSPAKAQGHPPVHPSKKPRHTASLDPDTEISNVRAEPHPWTHTYDRSASNTNPVGSPEPVSPARSPDVGNETDLDVSAQERESDPSPHQRQRFLPLSPPPQQTHLQVTESPPKPQTISTLPTGSNSHTWTEDDKNLIEQLKWHMSMDPGYNEFLESRYKQLTMHEQLKHYTYIAKQLEEYTCGRTNAKKVRTSSPILSRGPN